MTSVYHSTDELERLKKMLEEQPASAKRHTPELWDKRAEVWENELRTDEGRRDRNARRIADAAAFLREHGQLGPEHRVIDIGCGPGRFVTEFAKTAGHVTGVDFSPNMTKFGYEYAKSQGIENVDFVVCNFRETDPEAMGWKGAFDLVFSCTTPAIGNFGDLEKVISMSRGWCFNGGYVDCDDGLVRDAAENLFHRKYESRFNGWMSYATFNYLWLRGFSPYVSYYTEESMDKYEADRDLAAELVEEFGISRDDTASVEKVYRFLQQRKEEKGELIYPYVSRYIWLLWNVRDRVERN